MLNELEKSLLAVDNDFHPKAISNAVNENSSQDALGWIEGEYKWMSPEIKNMHPGWKKVVLTKGYTLIATTEITTGTDSGQNKNIRFWATENTVAGTETRRTSENRRFGYSGGIASGWDTNRAFLTPASTVRYDREGIQGTTYVSSFSATSLDASADANYPAGMYAVLWQYDPNNTFSDLPNLIFSGEENWKNFTATRLQYDEKKFKTIDDIDEKK